MNAKISVNGVGWKVEPRRWVLKILWVSNKNVPVMLGDLVTVFASVNCGKVEGAMDIGVSVCDIQPSMKRHKMLALSKGFGSVRRLYQMGRCQ
jgi:hypothetical protein